MNETKFNKQRIMNNNKYRFYLKLFECMIFAEANSAKTKYPAEVNVQGDFRVIPPWLNS